jgi:predicted small lipoprotein YifL
MRRAALLAASAAVLATGCGQKGPLYLPDQNAAVVTAPAAEPAPAPPPPAAPNSPQPKKTDDPGETQSAPSPH